MCPCLCPHNDARTRLRERIPSTGRWKPIPKDLTTTRMSPRDSLNHRRRRKRHDLQPETLTLIPNWNGCSLD